MAYLLGTRRGLRRLRLGPRHVRRPRPRPSPEPAQGAPPGATRRRSTYDEMVAFKRAVVRALGGDRDRHRCSIPRSARAQCIADGSLPGRAGPHRRHRGHRLRGAADGARQPRPARAGASSRRSAWARRPRSCSSTTTPTPPTPPTRSGSSPTSPRPAAPPTSPCSSSRSAFDLRRGQAHRRGAPAASSSRPRGGSTALGGDVLKAEFPYDPSVDRRGRAGRDACAELDAASPVPWVLLSGGVDDATFERQVDGRLPGRGVSGVLVGRSVWAPSATLPAAERDAWLATEGRARLARLVAPRRRRWARRGAPALGPRPAAPEPRRARLVRAVLTVPMHRGPGQRDLDLLVVGEINPDVVVPGPGSAAGASGRPSGCVDGDPARRSAARPSITACGAARLGLRVAMVGVVGDDALGRFMLEAMADARPRRRGRAGSTRPPTGARVILSATARTGRSSRRRARSPTSARRDVPAAPPRAGAPRPRRQLLPPAAARPRTCRRCSGRPGRAGRDDVSLDPNWDPSGRWDGGFAAAGRRDRRPPAQRRRGGAGSTGSTTSTAAARSRSPAVGAGADWSP